MNIFLILDVLLVILSLYFGINAALMFNTLPMGEVIQGITTQKKHKTRLLYSTVFMGSTLTVLSIVQGIRYLNGIIISYSELAILAVNLSFLAITYTWYSFLMDIRIGRS